MSLVYVTSASGDEIHDYLSTPFPGNEVTSLVKEGKWVGCPIWTITKKPDGIMYAYVRWEGKDRPVPMENVPKPIQMRLLTGAY